MTFSLQQGATLIEENAEQIDRTDPTQRKRRAILVHAGDFAASTGPIEFDETRLQVVARNMNAMRQILINEYGGKVPLGAWAPILDGHEENKNGDVVGRLSGAFVVERRDVPKVGKDIPCLITDEITFLGAETVSQVDDGRIYHLSVGIDEDTDMLTETSTVVTPAAPGAMLLSKAKTAKKGTPLAAAPSIADNKTKGKQAMPTPPKKLARRVNLGEVKTLIKAASDSAKLAKETKATTARLQSTGRVTAKLSALVKAGKMSPAEFKKAPIAKLAAATAEAQELYASAFESREPVIAVGQVGTTDAVDAVELGKHAAAERHAKLKAEAHADMARKTGKPAPTKLKATSGATAKLSADADKPEAKMGFGTEQTSTQKLAEQVPDKSPELSSASAMPEEIVNHMQAMQTQMDNQATQLAKMGDVLKSLIADMEAEDAEEQELAEAEGDVSQMAVEGDDDAELAASDDSDSAGKVSGEPGDGGKLSAMEGKGEDTTPEQKDKK